MAGRQFAGEVSKIGFERVATSVIASKSGNNANSSSEEGGEHGESKDIYLRVLLDQ